MGRPLRFVPRDHLVEVTCRTIHRRFLLRPGKEINRILIGALGRAQRRYGLTIHGVVFLSNHYHLLCAPRDAAQLVEVMRLVNSKIAREVGKLYNWKEKVWGRRYEAIVLTQEHEIHVQKLRYLLAHGVKEALVERGLDWPGVHCARALLTGEALPGLWFDRRAEGEAKRTRRKVDSLDFAEPEQIELTPLPGWGHLPQETIRLKVQALLDEIENEAVVKRSQKELPSAMGPRRVKNQEPHHYPVKPNNSPAPSFHGKSRALLTALKEAYRAFVAAYRAAAEKLRQGYTNVQFPEGSFPPPLPFVRGSPLPECG